MSYLNFNDFNKIYRCNKSTFFPLVDLINRKTEIYIINLYLKHKKNIIFNATEIHNYKLTNFLLEKNNSINTLLLNAIFRLPDIKLPNITKLTSIKKIHTIIFKELDFYDLDDFLYINKINYMNFNNFDKFYYMSRIEINRFNNFIDFLKTHADFLATFNMKKYIFNYTRNIKKNIYDSKDDESIMELVLKYLLASIESSLKNNDFIKLEFIATINFRQENLDEILKITNSHDYNHIDRFLKEKNLHIEDIQSPKCKTKLIKNTEILLPLIDNNKEETIENIKENISNYLSNEKINNLIFHIKIDCLNNENKTKKLDAYYENKIIFSYEAQKIKYTLYLKKNQ